MYFLSNMGIFQPAMLVYQRAIATTLSNPFSPMTQSRFFLETGHGWEKHFYSSTKKHSKFIQSTAFEWLKNIPEIFFVTPKKKCSTKKTSIFWESTDPQKEKKTLIFCQKFSCFQSRLLSSFKNSCNLFHSSKLTAWKTCLSNKLRAKVFSRKPLRLQPVESWWKSLV